MSLTNRRDVLFDAYMTAASAAGKGYRAAKDAFSAAFTQAKGLAYPSKPNERSTDAERAAYDAEVKRSTTQTDKARVLDKEMQARVDRPEWLAAGLLKPRKSVEERRAELEAKLARLK